MRSRSLRLSVYALAACAGLVSLGGDSFGCTAFLYDQGPSPLSAKRFDFYSDLGLITTHLRGRRKVALTNAKFKGTPASWVSKYGSVTFGMLSTEFPLGGINEAGLTVESLFNFSDTDSDFPDESGSLPYINNRQWLMFFLDQAATLDEVVSLASSVRVQVITPPNHLFVCDASRKCGVIEYQAGKLVITGGNQLVEPLITNYLYEASIGGLPDQSGDTRFTRAAQLIAQPPSPLDPMGYAFWVLDQVPLGPSYTGWEVVYDLSQREMNFRSKESPEIKKIDLPGLDFSSGGSPVMMDIHLQGAGDVTSRFIPYSDALDAGYVRNFFSTPMGIQLERKFPGIAAAIIDYRTTPDRRAQSPDRITALRNFRI